MINHLIEKSDNINSGFYLNNYPELKEKLIYLENGNKETILFGVSYALLNLVDYHKFRLNKTTIIETGGMKGNRKELTQRNKLTTNNRMELTAVIKALEAIKTNNIKVTIYSDSKYVVESIEKGWIWNWEKKNFKKKQNIDLWKQFIPLYKKFNIKFVWVKGHAGIKENERCDELANLAQSSNLINDTGYKV